MFGASHERLNLSPNEPRFDAASRTRETRLARVSLRVRDLAESMAFYEGVLGLAISPSSPPSARSCVCTLEDGDGHVLYSIELTQGRGNGHSAALQHIGLEASDAVWLDEVYDRARAHGHRAIPPWRADGVVSAIVFDPDGVKIRIAWRPPTRDDEAHADTQAAPERS